MATLYLTEQGAVLRREDQRLVVTRGEETLVELPVIKVDQVVVMGNVQVTTPALALLLERDVEVAFLTIHGRYRGRLVGLWLGNGLLRQAQYQRTTEPRFGLITAKRIVRAKIANQCALLRWHRETFGRPEVEEAVAQLTEFAGRLEGKREVGEVMGIEGSATAAYFGCLRNTLRVGLGFERRQRRPPPDPVNALLSFGYTLLTNQVRSFVELAGLDPFLGFLHGPRYNRPSLALDLVEEFRAPVADWVVLRALNFKVVQPRDFEHNDGPEGGMLLNEAARKRFIAEYEARLRTPLMYQGARQTFQRVIELQVRQMARVVQQPDGRYQPFEWQP